MLVSMIVLRKIRNQKLYRLLRLLINLSAFIKRCKFFSFHVLKDFLTSK